MDKIPFVNLSIAKNGYIKLMTHKYLKRILVSYHK